MQEWLYCKCIFFFMLQADWSMELSIDVFLPSQ